MFTIIRIRDKNGTFKIMKFFPTNSADILNNLSITLFRINKNKTITILNINTFADNINIKHNFKSIGIRIVIILEVLQLWITESHIHLIGDMIQLDMKIRLWIDNVLIRCEFRSITKMNIKLISKSIKENNFAIMQAFRNV